MNKVRKIEENCFISYILDDQIEEYKVDIQMVDCYVDEDNFQHNEPGLPSLIIYDTKLKDKKSIIEFTVHGKYHNLTGPASINYNNGFIYYFIDGKKLTKEVFDVERNRLLMLEEL